ncbi:hypothetical protein [Rhodococcus coprophilus]|uniref:Uncharacterized protein n=1 Tax=Rhodococcus coprophilus TaxID=38310 RepID=A0A2X4TRL2_9NOCA|nr:hypothetical protein [Rhodococcus coprophilus]MBM7461485.1 uncharacterized protein YukE [Rhodococcus coprophilus]SQI29493.1 Uncharacterised protein [Rhodococcus coprophilus]
MPIDTFIDGDPADISRVGHSIRRHLAAAVAATGDDAEEARRIADDAWEGEASDRYLREASRIVQVIDELHARTLSAADDFDTLSVALASALADMSDIRDRAASAGLPVVCDTIADPGPNSDESLLRIYDELAGAATDVHRRWAREIAGVTHRWTNPAWAALFTTTTGFDYLTGELAQRVDRLAQRASMCLEHSGRSMQAVLDLAPGTPYDEVRRLFGQAKASTDDLAGTLAKHTNLAHVPTRLAVGTGALGLVAGVGIDYFAGEPLEQAVVSNSAGLAASITAGAILGSALPGAGTLVGALAGTAVGIVTAGSVDHVYEDSSATILSTLDAGRREAVEAIDALVDLGRAVRGGLTDGN